MQRLAHRCPRCDQPLGISCDMWGKYYLCGGCGFTAEDDDELAAGGAGLMSTPGPELTEMEAYWPRQAATRQ